MAQKKENAEKASELVKQLADLLDLQEFELVSYKSLFLETQAAHVLEIDNTPKIVDPELGPGSGDDRITCLAASALDIAGVATTEENGRLRWRFNEFLCQARPTLRPVSFVATPLSPKPVLLTTRIVTVGNDLVIDVFSWDTLGNPAARVTFSWRCWTQVPFA